MVPTHPLQRVWRLTPPGFRLAVFGVGLYLVGLVSVLGRPVGGATSMWWPAAGITIAALLVASPRQRPFIAATAAVAGIVSNITPDRPLTVAVLFGLLNLGEALLVVAIMSRGRQDPRTMRRLGDVMRMLVAVVCGAAVAGGSVAVVTVVLLDGSFAVTAVNVALSHASAAVVAISFALRTTAAPTEANRGEVAAQWVILLAATAVVFSPGQTHQLQFLLVPTLLWPALRSSLRTAMLQLSAVGLLVTVATVQGHGPFAAVAASTGGWNRTSIGLVQLLIMTLAIVLLAIAVLVAERRTMFLELARREELFRVGFTESLLGLLLVRPDEGTLRIVELNGVAARMLGGHAVDLVGADWCARFGDADRARVHAAIDAVDREGAAGWHGEVGLDIGGVTTWFEMSISPAVEDTSVGHLLTVQMVDVTARREAEARLALLALRDGLTGLANRTLLDERLIHALSEARRTRHGVGVIFLDLDRFKPINDTYGHATGDQVLVELAARLTRAVRGVDTVARLGGDEFVIVCPNIDAAGLRGVQARIHAQVAEPLIVGSLTLRLRASSGTALGHGGSEPRELLRRADAAMYAQKLTVRRPTASPFLAEPTPAATAG